MKKIIILFCILATVFSACDKDHAVDVFQKNEKKVTIQTGVWGTVTFREGNCMPGIGRNSCSENPVVRQVRIYEKTRLTDVINYNNLEPRFFEGFTTSVIKEVDTDNEGFFQVALPAGEYTLVVVENNKLYANSFQDSNGELVINTLSIESGLASKLNFLIDYKAAY